MLLGFSPMEKTIMHIAIGQVNCSYNKKLYYRLLVRGCGQVIVWACTCYYWIFSVWITDLRFG